MWGASNWFSFNSIEAPPVEGGNIQVDWTVKKSSDWGGKKSPDSNTDVLLSQLPCGREPEQSTSMQIVKVGNEDASTSRDEKNPFGVSIRCGKLRMEFRDGISIDLLAALVRTLGETGVL